MYVIGEEYQFKDEWVTKVSKDMSKKMMIKRSKIYNERRYSKSSCTTWYKVNKICDHISIIMLPKYNTL